MVFILNYFINAVRPAGFAEQILNYVTLIFRVFSAFVVLTVKFQSGFVLLALCDVKESGYPQYILGKYCF